MAKTAHLITLWFNRSMTLRPEMSAFLEAQRQLNAPPLWEVPLFEIREGTQARVDLTGSPEEIFQIENLFIPGPTADLPIRIYRPRNVADAPALLYFHGGGFVLNFLDIYDASLARLANQSGRTIISVNYQKAPEHPFPIPFDDCFATLQWVHKSSARLRINPTKIGVSGDSAGANLASAVALKARDNSMHIEFQALIYPCNSLDFHSPTYVEFAEGFGLTTEAMKWFWAQYLQGDQHNENPYAVPSTATSFHGLAPAIIIAAQYDPLRSDGQNYAELLRRDGVAVSYREFEGVLHGFFSNVALTPIAHEAIDYLGQWIKSFESNQKASQSAKE